MSGLDQPFHVDLQPIFVFILLIIFPTEQTNAILGCRKPFLYFQNKCYYFSHDQRFFFKAEKVCGEFSSPSNPCHLTSIHSEEENSFVNQRAKQLWGYIIFWLGATKDNTKGDDLSNKFNWLDGSPMNLTKFVTFNNPGECLQQWKRRGWDDCYCSLNKKYFVCKTAPDVPFLPPRLSLSLDGVTIVNKTYKGNETDFREEQDKYVEEGEEITITCFAEGAKPVANLSWIINGIPDEGVNTKPISNSNENRTFDSNSTLIFNATDENITATCNSSLYESDIQTFISATILTYVKPNVSLIVYGSKVSDTLYLVEGESANITCHASGARPPAKLTWRGIYNLVEKGPSESDQNESTSTTILFEARKVIENVTCTSRIEGANITDEVSLKVLTCAVPKVSLTVGKYNASDVISVNKSEEVDIVCNVSGARPAASITFKKNGKTVTDKTYEVKVRDKVNDSLRTYPGFEPQDNDTIECVSTLVECDIVEVVKIKFVVNADFSINTESSSQNLTSAWAIPAAVITFVILVIYCVYNAINRYKASRSTDLSALQLGLSGLPLNGVTNISRDLPPIRQSMISTHDEPSEISYNEDKISTVTDVKLTVQLPGEGTIQYWTAIGSFQQESNKKIIAKCVSESAQMKEHLNFKTLADGLITLKKHRNIVEVLGVSTSNVPYFIYTEFFEYGTLRDFLLRNYQQSRDSHTNVAQTLDETAIHLTSFALDVADALMFLTDRDYRHPALCARKILLNKMCICKLYDFWPKTLATERMNNILQQPLPPLAWLSPETIFLRSYSKKSDLWNFGIVLWEIYSLGEIPYKGLTCEEIEQEIRKMRYLEQPLICPGGIFSMMLASWDTSVEDRPELSEWKQKLVCLLQSVKQEKEDQNGDGGNGDQKYFTLENNVCDYEDDYIEQ